MNNNIQYFAELLNNYSLKDAISLFLTIISIITAIIFYLNGKKSKIPTYILRTISLVQEKIQKIETVKILYSGNKVDNLSISKIAFWNAGKDTIDHMDIAQNNPIRLIIEENYLFLEANIIYQKNPSNNFNISLSDNNKYIDITFDYFDYEEGIVLQVFHTGNTSKNITLIGQVKSVKKIHRKDNSRLFMSSIDNILSKKIKTGSNFNLILGWTVLIIGLFVIFFSFIPTYIQTPQKEYNPDESKFIANITLFILGVIYSLMGYSMVKRKIPKGFNVFNEEF